MVFWQPAAPIVTTNGGHGRVERRRIWTTSDVAWFAERSKWKNLRSLIRVEAQRTVNGETSTEYRYYISDLPADNPAKEWSLRMGRLMLCSTMSVIIRLTNESTGPEL